ncbi:Protein CT_858 [Chlamydiales bacterium SCGC AG-110-M15]|nr:Protein CT_858 [Chlamydiales bacterium SCGC AG-110-M15]
MRRFYIWLSLFITIIFPLNESLSASQSRTNEPPSLLQQQMLRDLDFVHNNFDAYYAPSEWKKRHFAWDLDTQINKAKASVLANKEVSLKDYHQILRGFFNSTRDYHVSVHSVTTEKATLPFMIKGVKGRYFFVYLDRDKLPKEIFPFEIGDELLEFDGRPVHDVIQEIKHAELGNDGTKIGDANDFTDQALAEIYLTSRRDNTNKIPKGPITLLCRAQKDDEGKPNSKAKEAQLVWDYFPEWVIDSRQARYAFDPRTLQRKQGINNLFNKQMLPGRWPHLMSLQNHLPSCSHNLGSKKSFLPRLGKIVWEAPESCPFDAYLFLDGMERLIGYVRIPHYVAGAPHVNEFAELMKEFELKTKALVIDQVNNPGGSVFYLYSLASIFAEHPFSTPKHRMKIGQDEVMFSRSCLERFSYISNNQEAKWAFGGSNIDGYPINYQFIQLLKSYCQFIIDEWNEGKMFTDPYHLYGVDKIHVSPKAKYTKDILLLTNELDFSGGDFFPAIMQDNKRAKIMGARTAGAGGYVLQTSHPNNLGVDSFSVTGSIAERVDNNPIENLGVSPDWSYEITEKDVQGEYEGYKNEILSVLTMMLEGDL